MNFPYAHNPGRLLARFKRYLKRACTAVRIAGVADVDELTIRMMTEYDMVSEPSEQYYARQYLTWILKDVSSRFPHAGVQVLDLGCGQGRLSLPLAQWCATDGGRVLGVDMTPEAVGRARQYASDVGLTNAAFHEARLLDFLPTVHDNFADVLLLVEVIYTISPAKGVLKEAARVLKPKGLMFVSFRSQYFNILHSVRNRMWDSADMAVSEREGYLFDGSILFNWQTTTDILRLAEDLQLSVVGMRAIGAASGIDGDPMAAIACPGALPAHEQERLMAIESSLAEVYPDCGRYILATFVKDG